MQFLYSGITSGSIYGLVALGFNIIYNATGIINFAQGEFVMIGGMLIYTFFAMLGWPFYMAFPAAVVIAFGLGLVFERTFIGLVRKKTEINLITVTIAASIILRDIGMLLWGRDALRVGEYVPFATVDLPGGVLTTQSFVVIASGLSVALGLSFFLKSTRYGKAMRACFDDQSASTLCGIDVKRVRMFSFGVASTLGAIAGVVISPITFVTYSDGLMAGLKGFAAAVLGGLGSFWGAIAGGYLLGILEAFSASVIPSGYKDAMAFLVILVILFVRPAGLFGKKRVHRV